VAGIDAILEKHPLPEILVRHRSKLVGIASKRN
jgi:hypothetical protein